MKTLVLLILVLMMNSCVMIKVKTKNRPGRESKPPKETSTVEEVLKNMPKLPGQRRN